MNSNFEPFRSIQSAVDAVKWLFNRLPPPVDGLDEARQRRLVLRWAKNSAEELRIVRRSAALVEDVERRYREEIWTCLVFGWWVFPLFILPSEIGKVVDLRRAIGENHETWLADPDPLCDQWALEAEIRRQLRELPWSARRKLGSVKRELERVSKHYEAFEKKRAVVEAARQTMRAGSDRRASLTSRIESETDAVTRASLERQLQAVEGQDAALERLESWRRRIEAAQAECTDALRHLHAQIAVLAAGDAGTLLAASERVVSPLRDLNTHLSHAQEASEEVLQLTRA